MLQKISLSFGPINANTTVIVTDSGGTPAVLYSTDNLASLISRVGQTRTDSLGLLDVYVPSGKLYKVYRLDASGKTQELVPASTGLISAPSLDAVESIKAASSTNVVGQVVHDGNGNIYDSNGSPLSVGGVGQNTNLTYSQSATSVSINSSSGTDISIPGASQTLAGVMVASDKLKLDDLSQYTDALAKDASAAVITSGTHSGLTVSYNGTSKALNFTVATQSTNLSQVAAPTKITIGSSSGTGVDLPLVTGVNAGLMSPVDKNRLDGLVTYSAPVAKDDVSSMFIGVTHTGLSVNYDSVLKKLTFQNTQVTDLGNGAGADTLTITSSTGASTILPSATVGTAGVMTSTDKLKLDGLTQYTDTQAKTAAAAIITSGTHSGITATYDTNLQKINFSVTAGALGANLGATYTANYVGLTSSTGTGVNLQGASQTTAGVLTSADKAKIDNLLVVFTGSTQSQPGLAGLVPVPPASSVDIFLSNSGWKSMTTAAYSEVLRRVFVSANGVSATLVLQAVGAQSDLDAVTITVDGTGASLTLSNVATSLKLRNIMLHAPASFNSTTSFTFLVPDPYQSSNTMDNLIFPQFMHYNLASPSIIQAQTGIAVSIANNLISVMKTGLTAGAAAKYQLRM